MKILSLSQVGWPMLNVRPMLSSPDRGKDPMGPGRSQVGEGKFQSRTAWGWDENQIPDVCGLALEIAYIQQLFPIMTSPGLE